MVCFINLPLRWVAHDPHWLDWFIARGISPELGIDAQALALDDDWHATVAQKLRTAGLSCSVHLPFFDMAPGIGVAAVLTLSRERLRRAADLARLYGAAHMVGHPDFRAARDGVDAREDAPCAAWLERSADSWRSLPERAEAPLFLENTYERSPFALKALLDYIANPAIGLCFDVGHWHHFADGVRQRNLSDWLRVLAPVLRHLHVHDNDGSADQHRGLGQGSIPFALFLEELQKNKLSPSVTLEPHTAEDLDLTAVWFEEHAGAQALFGWKPLGKSGFSPPDAF